MDEQSSKGTKKMCCASCGESDGSLKMCTACKSVWYCNVTCQRAHRSLHKAECKAKEKAIQDAKNGKAYKDVTFFDVGDGIKAMKVSSTHRTVVSRNIMPSSSPAASQKAKATPTANDDKDDNDDDDGLFDPPPPREECPVCMVTLPLLNEEAVYKECCGHIICRGCIFENKRVLHENNARRSAKKLPPLEECCPFCREEFYESDEEYVERLQKRMEHDDAMAIYNIAGYYRSGMRGFPIDMNKFFELTVRAAELGLSDAYYNLSCCYGQGVGIPRDPVKERHYLELAAKKGEIMARHNLGCNAEIEGNLDLAFRHWKMAASAGSNSSLKAIEGGFRAGYVSKEDYAAVLRAHQKAWDDQRTEQRERYKRTDLGNFGHLGS